jgi:hypothetical protein
MTHEEIQSHVNQTDKFISVKKQVQEAEFILESVLMLQGHNFYPHTLNALKRVAELLKKSLRLDTPDANAINEYIAEQNAQFEARCKAEGAKFWCVNALTADDLAEQGVHTLEQYKSWQAENERLCAEKEDRKRG